MPYRVQPYTAKNIEKIRVGYEALGKSLAMTALQEKGRPWAVQIAMLAGYPESWVNYWLNWAEKEPEMEKWAAQQEQKKKQKNSKWRNTFQGRKRKNAPTQKETVMAMGLWRDGYNIEQAMDALVSTRSIENQAERLIAAKAIMDVKQSNQGR